MVLILNVEKLKLTGKQNFTTSADRAINVTWYLLLASENLPSWLQTPQFYWVVESFFVVLLRYFNVK